MENRNFYSHHLVNQTRFGSQFNKFSKYDKKKKTLFVLLSVFIFFIIIFGFWFTRNVLIGLPDVSKIKDMVFSEATIIEDRNGNTLYKLFQENREYVSFEKISINMINAIIAIEDQRYREHNGLDTMGIIRAGLKKLFHPFSRMQGASTIPQQLIRNLLLTKDRKLARKLKEIILTSRLGGVLEKQILQEKGNISQTDLRKKMKNRTLELYLNYISFGNNAFGVESASKAYFNKSSKDLSILESSILASIPKGPSLYDPYKKRSLVMGKFTITDSFGKKIEFTGGLKQTIIQNFSQIILNTDLSSKNNENAFAKYIKSAGNFSVNDGGNIYKIQYENGRKDLVLDRMYEDGYINQQQLKESFISGFDYQFRKNTFEILAPHFVQWIIEELEKKYDSSTLLKGGFIIKTTLDLDIQKLAEQSLTSNNAVLQDNGANNSSMIYLDSTNGEVLAYVGSIDYFNQEIEGQNDMVRRPRQSGSSIKPFIYALGFEKLPLTIDTPIFDIPFKIGKDIPSNADDKFEGLLPLKKALGHSRNIPATKMITALGGELVAKPFLQKLGLKSISDNVEYGYPLALGAAEITMLEFVNAYSHLSTATPAVINPILEIRSRDGSILYQKTGTNYQEQLIPNGIRYLIRKILSDPNNRLAGWISKFNVAGLTFALKTGTSDMKTDKGNRARDGWLAVYTPTKVALFWAGNANGAAMNKNAFGGTILANPLKSFFGNLLKNNYISNENIPEADITKVQISKISGKLAGVSTPSEFIVDTIKYSKGPNLSTDDGAQIIQIDSLCNGLVSPYTSPEDTKNGYVIIPNTFMPNGMDLTEITQRRKDSNMMTLISGSTDGLYFSGKVTYNFNNIFTIKPENICSEREQKQDANINVQINNPISNADISKTFTVGFVVQSPKNIRRITVLLDDQQVANFSYDQGNTKNLTDNKQVILLGTGFTNGKHLLKVVAVDFAGFSNQKEISVNLISNDTQIPKLLENKIKVTKNADGKYVISLIFEDASGISDGKITRNGNTLYEFSNSNIINFTLDSLDPIVINIQDAYKNTLNQTIDLNKYNQ
ncbi:MAG: transglycosylase domain-containing protein [Candidatus Absconditabacterales bacterium]